MNVFTPEQVLNQIKEAQAAMVEMTARSLEAIEKHIDLNLKAAKANLADATEAGSQLLSVKDAAELYAAAQGLAQPAVSKAASYGRNVYAINAEAASEFTKMVEARMEEANKAFSTALNDLSKNAPAGSEGMVALMKSAFSASNSALDAMQKASKQVVEMIESNVEAAAKAGEAAVGQAAAATKAPARRKAAAE